LLCHGGLRVASGLLAVVLGLGLELGLELGLGAGAALAQAPATGGDAMAPAPLVAPLPADLAPSLAPAEPAPFVPPQAPAAENGAAAVGDPPASAPETAGQPADASSPLESAAPEESAATKESVSPAVTPDAFLPSALPHDLSPWGMFKGADPIVQAVMIGLAFASVVTWTVWLAKTFELWGAKRSARHGLETISGARSLRAAEKDLGSPRAPVSLLVKAAVGEAERSIGLAPDGVKERTAMLLSRIEARASRNMTRGTGVLGTIGATAPFVGLFGTVWGIMNSFIGISQSNTTNLAVVAPGIAEALLATALGLVAAIPAVVIYNVFARSIAGYRVLLADAAAEVMRHLSRDLDREALPRPKEESHVIPLRQPAE
jgi:biopolymer transport protein ExbB